MIPPASESDFRLDICSYNGQPAPWTSYTPLDPSHQLGLEILKNEYPSAQLPDPLVLLDLQDTLDP